jgi:hypothetical protein
VPKIKKAGWGGKRKGAGRKPVLALLKRRKIANDYFARMGPDRELLSDSPRREAVIRKLMAKYGVAHRMVERCLAEFLPCVRRNSARWAYATEGLNEIHSLPAPKIEKLKPGVYAHGNLRLVVDRAGNRKWLFRFIWQHTIIDMVLGGPEMSLTMARKLATKASRMLASGQNPIDGSWSSADLQSADCFRVQRKIVLDEIEALLVQHYPGQAAADKKRKVVREHFGTSNWTEISQQMGLLALRAGYNSLHERLEKKPSRYVQDMKPAAPVTNGGDVSHRRARGARTPK